MSFRQLGFKQDDDEFFQDLFDSDQRSLQLARYSGARWRHMVGFYVMSFFFAFFVLFYLGLGEKGTTLIMAFVSLFFSMNSLSQAMSADGKYKMARIVDALASRQNNKSDDQ